jgi:hypothetical protein
MRLRGSAGPTKLAQNPGAGRPPEPTLNEKPRLMEITGRGLLKKEVPSWAAALRDTNTASRYENMTGKPH